SLYSILKFLDRSIERTVVLPREGVICDMLRRAEAADRLVFEPNLVENPYEPWSRAIARADFDAPAWLKAVRASGNVARVSYGFSRLASLVKTGGFDLVYCNGTTANFIGGLLSAYTQTPSLWHVRYT